MYKILIQMGSIYFSLLAEMMLQEYLTIILEMDL